MTTAKKLMPPGIKEVIRIQCSKDGWIKILDGNKWICESGISSATFYRCHKDKINDDWEIVDISGLTETFSCFFGFFDIDDALIFKIKFGD